MVLVSLIKQQGVSHLCCWIKGLCWWDIGSPPNRFVPSKLGGRYDVVGNVYRYYAEGLERYRFGSLAEPWKKYAGAKCGIAGEENSKSNFSCRAGIRYGLLSVSNIKSKQLNLSLKEISRPGPGSVGHGTSYGDDLQNLYGNKTNKTSSPTPVAAPSLSAEEEHCRRRKAFDALSNY